MTASSATMQKPPLPRGYGLGRAAVGDSAGFEARGLPWRQRRRTRKANRWSRLRLGDSGAGSFEEGQPSRPMTAAQEHRAGLRQHLSWLAVRANMRSCIPPSEDRETRHVADEDVPAANSSSMRSRS